MSFLLSTTVDFEVAPQILNILPRFLFSFIYISSGIYGEDRVLHELEISNQVMIGVEECDPMRYIWQWIYIGIS